MKLLLGFLFAVLISFATNEAAKSAVCFQPHSLDGDGFIACRAYFPSWTYDSSKKKCVEFIYGGCGGNKNRFPTKEHCEKVCSK